MSYCIKCGKNADPEDVFCTKCGASLESKEVPLTDMPPTVHPQKSTSTSWWKIAFISIALILTGTVAYLVWSNWDNIIGEADEYAVPPNFATYTDGSGLFSISYPSDWDTALFLIEDLEEWAKDIITSIESNAPVDRVGVIFAAGIPTTIGYSPNVNIAIESFSGTYTHDGLVEETIQTYEYFYQDYHEIFRTKIVVDGREMTIIEYEATLPGVGKQHQLQAIVLVEKTAWAITCTPPNGQYSLWEDDFNSIMRSLRIL